MTIEQLTDLELEVLKNFYDSAWGNGHDFGFTEDHGIKPSQARGVISSLIKKKIIDVHEAIKTETGTWHQFTWHGKNPCDIKSLEDVLK
jgi:hypothetical protein